MVVSVRLSAGLRERAGADRLEVELPDGARVADVLAAMASTPVGALGPRECVVAVNREYAGADAVVRAGDEVALVPPVSGGSGAVRRIRVTREAFAGARAVIDRVKAEAPIWKVEVDGADRRRVEGTLPPA